MATGSTVSDLVLNAWQRKARELCGMTLVPVPKDPFALPTDARSDPLRCPIYVPFNPEVTLMMVVLVNAIADSPPVQIGQDAQRPTKRTSRRRTLTIRLPTDGVQHASVQRDDAHVRDGHAQLLDVPGRVHSRIRRNVCAFLVELVGIAVGVESFTVASVEKGQSRGDGR